MEYLWVNWLHIQELDHPITDWLPGDYLNFEPHLANNGLQFAIGFGGMWQVACGMPPRTVRGLINFWDSPVPAPS